MNTIFYVISKGDNYQQEVGIIIDCKPDPQRLHIAHASDLDWIGVLSLPQTQKDSAFTIVVSIRQEMVLM